MTRPAPRPFLARLRNPLAVILGRCEMLEGGALGELSEAQQRSVGIIHRNATRVVDALEALVDALEALDPSPRPDGSTDPHQGG